MTLPRWGDQTLMLVRGGSSTQLASGFDSTFTQRGYLASPGGRFVAFAGDHGELVLMDRAGHRIRVDNVFERDVRFSTDGRYAATVAGIDADVTVIDLKTGDQRKLGRVREADWLEWTRDGVVVSQAGADAAHRLLSYFPLDGEMRTLARVDGAGMLRFTTARTGSRVVYFAYDAVAGHTDIYEVDTAVAGHPIHLGQVSGFVNNAEASPDGREVAITSSAGLYRISGSEKPRLIAGTGSTIHTVWFSPDGTQLAYAFPGNATVVDLATDRSYELSSANDTLRALRFSQLGRGLVVVRGNRVLLWHPREGKTRVLASAPPNKVILGADRFAGGTIVWSAKDNLAPRPQSDSKPLPKWQRVDRSALRQQQRQIKPPPKQTKAKPVQR